MMARPVTRLGDAVAGLRAAVGWALPAQVAWAVLAAVWNFVGVYRIAEGAQALGPTATVGGGVFLLVLAVGFVVTISRWPVVYVLLSIVGGLAAAAAVGNAFIADPALWPSTFWRLAGVALNAVGFVAAASAVVAAFKWISRR
jgi:hypothetical protein